MFQTLYFHYPLPLFFFLIKFHHPFTCKLQTWVNVSEKIIYMLVALLSLFRPSPKHNNYKKLRVGNRSDSWIGILGGCLIALWIS